MRKRTSWQRRVPEENSMSMSASVKRRLIGALTKPKLQRDDYHLLSRKQQVILVRLRTSHNRLNSHMHRKLKLAPLPTCPCGQEEQTAEHVLQRCPLYEATEDVWPVSTSLTTKLYGCKQELEKTTSFISEQPWSCRLRTPRRTLTITEIKGCSKFHGVPIANGPQSRREVSILL